MRISVRNASPIILVSFLFFLSCGRAIFPKPEIISPKEPGQLIDPRDIVIKISIPNQTLYLLVNGTVIRNYIISTSRYGVGNIANSFKTPYGFHHIYKKIGANEPLGRVFIGRKPLWVEPILEQKQIFSDNRSYITTRILWLAGEEGGYNKGFNKKGKSVDTQNRFIYIHGTNKEWLVGAPASLGCIYMKNKDIVELFDLVFEGTRVLITFL